MPAVNPQEKIVVVGFGWVGQANALAFSRLGYDVYFYDVVTPPRHYAQEYGEVYDRVRPLRHVLEVDSAVTWYIVCIGDRVSAEGNQDISLIERALQGISGAKGKVILRSTVLPACLERLRFDIYFPEFLHELKAVEECFHPYYFVLGWRNEIPLPVFLKEWQERAYKVFIGTPEEAAHIKYLSNIWNAARIAFVNEFGDSIAPPASQSKRQEIERVLDFVFEKKSYLRYGQGFGGHCLPKDLRAYTRSKVDAGRTVSLLTAIQESNDAHERVVATYQTLPQWFSFWEDGGGHDQLHPLAQWWKKVNTWVIVRSFRRVLQPLRRALERFVPVRHVAQLKRQWNSWALDNPYYYSNPDTISGKKVDEFEIRESGQADYLAYVVKDSRLTKLLGTFADKAALEIGCGVGRMTEYFAKDFGAVYGIDISPAMIEVATKRLRHLPQVKLRESNGRDLPFPDAYFDLIFSYLVFRHLPTSEMITAYFREIARTLKPNGLMKVQVRTGPEVYRWRWFHGISLTPQLARSLIEQSGLTVLATEQENAKSLWLVAQK